MWNGRKLQHCQLLTFSCSVQVATQYSIFINGPEGLVNKALFDSLQKRRGSFLSMYALMTGVGILLSYCLGSGLYWRYMGLLPPCLYVVLGLCLFLIPESPIWLLSHHGEQAARDALTWLRYIKHESKTFTFTWSLGHQTMS